MSVNDILLVLQWWVFLLIIGICFLPLTTNIFSNFVDRGYAFSKIIGVILVTYILFILGIFHILSFSRVSVVIIIVCLTLLQIYKFRIKFLKSLLEKKFLIATEEILLLGGIFLWTYIRGLAPEIHGLEKYMDYGFINSILRSEFFPPKDMWLAPFSINYYYFGHLITAILTKLSGIGSQNTYNLMLGSLVGLTFTMSFSIGMTLFASIFEKLKASTTKIILAGILTGMLVTFSGNLHTLYTFFKPYENENPVPPFAITLEKKCVDEDVQSSRNTGCDEDKLKLKPVYSGLEFSPNTFPNSYWYPNATRFIHNTIHEFPIYSWVVADLHGHVLDIPIVLLSIGFALSLFLRSNKSSVLKKRSNLISRLDKIIKFDLSPIRVVDLIFGGLLLSVMYMTNAWDGLIYLMLFGLLMTFIFWCRRDSGSYLNRLYSIIPQVFVSIGIIFLSFVIFVLPFSIFFKPFASGIGLLCAPDFLIKIKEFGPFLFEANHCQRTPFWQLLILYGFFYFYVISFIVFLKKLKRTTRSDAFVILLIVLSSILIFVPEIIYLKDIYPDHYRANTMFKLVFQAFILLSISSGYIFVRIVTNIRPILLNLRVIPYLIFIAVSLILMTLVFMYPIQAVNSYYGAIFVQRNFMLTNPSDLNYASTSLKNSECIKSTKLTWCPMFPMFKGIDGTVYLKDSYPDDFKAILWLNENIKGQPVILEAQGDSYTDYARVSSNTGLPTVLGWTVHEWLWRGSYDVPAPRIADIQTLYETSDIKTTKKLISKYKIEYIFIGSLEREKYTALNEAKFKDIGSLIYTLNATRIYKLKK